MFRNKPKPQATLKEHTNDVAMEVTDSEQKKKKNNSISFNTGRLH